LDVAEPGRSAPNVKASAQRDCRILHIAYRPPEPESAAKAFDYSRESIRMRWQTGESAMQRALALCESTAKGDPNRMEYV
jgi:hypothetical protein